MKTFAYSQNIPGRSLDKSSIADPSFMKIPPGVISAFRASQEQEAYYYKDRPRSNQNSGGVIFNSSVLRKTCNVCLPHVNKVPIEKRMFLNISIGIRGSKQAVKAPLSIKYGGFNRF